MIGVTQVRSDYEISNVSSICTVFPGRAVALQAQVTGDDCLSLVSAIALSRAQPKGWSFNRESQQLRGLLLIPVFQVSD